MPLGPEDFERRLFRVVDHLDAARIPWFLTGALVRNLYGEQRTSRDMDVVIEMRGRSVDAVRDGLVAAGFSVEGPSKGNLGSRLILDVEGTPVDLWLAPDTDLHRREFERAKSMPYGDRTLVVMHPEDFVLRKIVNWRRIRGKTNDIDDAYQVLLHAWSEIDPERLIARAGGHRVEKTAMELVALVREDRAKLERGEPLE